MLRRIETGTPESSSATVPADGEDGFDIFAGAPGEPGTLPGFTVATVADGDAPGVPERLLTRFEDKGEAGCGCASNVQIISLIGTNMNVEEGPG